MENRDFIVEAIDKCDNELKMYERESFLLKVGLMLGWSLSELFISLNISSLFASFASNLFLGSLLASIFLMKKQSKTWVNKTNLDFMLENEDGEVRTVTKLRINELMNLKKRAVSTAYKYLIYYWGLLLGINLIDIGGWEFYPEVIKSFAYGITGLFWYEIMDLLIQSFTIKNEVVNLSEDNLENVMLKRIQASDKRKKGDENERK